MEWTTYCLATCLCSARLLGKPKRSRPVERPDLSQIPSEYHDLAKVFCKSRALSLQPHRLQDCKISLLPGATLATHRLYNLPRPEHVAMETFIQNFLAAGIIRPSTSPVGMGFFLWVRGMGVSIFLGLYNITVRICVFQSRLSLLSESFSVPSTYVSHWLDHYVLNAGID